MDHQSHPTPLRITMLGMSGSGKTCFLYGMYGLLGIRNRYNSFTIAPTDPDKAAEYDQGWKRLVTPGSSRWPVNPAERFDEHPFRLLYGLEAFASLEWVDYRGGIFDRSFSHKEMQTLFSYLKQSDCIFLTVSGQYLRDGLSIDDAEKSIRPQDMNRLMTQLLASDTGTLTRPFPIAIIVTKADYCLLPGFRRFRSTKRVMSDIETLFKPLFPENLQTERFMTAICAVSLGRELADNPTSGRVNPQHFDLPILFAAWAKLSKELTATKAMSKDRGRIKELEALVTTLRREIRKVPIFLNSKKIHL